MFCIFYNMRSGDSTVSFACNIHTLNRKPVRAIDLIVGNIASGIHSI